MFQQLQHMELSVHQSLHRALPGAALPLSALDQAQLQTELAIM